MAQSFEHLTVDFSSGPEIRVLGSSPESGSELSREAGWDSLSSQSLPTPHVHTLSFSQVN